MADRELIEIIIRAKDEASRTFEKLAAELALTDAQAKALGKDFDKIGEELDVAARKGKNLNEVVAKQRVVFDQARESISKHQGLTENQRQSVGKLVNAYEGLADVTTKQSAVTEELTRSRQRLEQTTKRLSNLESEITTKQANGHNINLKRINDQIRALEQQDKLTAKQSDQLKRYYQLQQDINNSLNKAQRSSLTLARQQAQQAQQDFAANTHIANQRAAIQTRALADNQRFSEAQIRSEEALTKKMIAEQEKRNKAIDQLRKEFARSSPSVRRATLSRVQDIESLGGTTPEELRQIRESAVEYRREIRERQNNDQSFEGELVRHAAALRRLEYQERSARAAALAQFQARSVSSQGRIISGDSAADVRKARQQLAVASDALREEQRQVLAQEAIEKEQKSVNQSIEREIKRHTDTLRSIQIDTTRLQTQDTRQAANDLYLQEKNLGSVRGLTEEGIALRRKALESQRDDIRETSVLDSFSQRQSENLERARRNQIDSLEKYNISIANASKGALAKLNRHEASKGDFRTADTIGEDVEKLRASTADIDRARNLLRAFDQDVKRNRQSLDPFRRSLLSIGDTLKSVGNAATAPLSVFSRLGPVFSYFVAIVVLATAAFGAFLALFQEGAVVVVASFTSALSAAVPVFGLFLAAFSRVGAVLKAVAAQTQVQNQTLQQTKDLAHQAVDSQYALMKAYEGVGDAQKQLVITRREALRQIQDLIYAEQQAVIATERANLALAHSQRALGQAIATGSGEDISAAQTDLQASGQDVRRANVDQRRAAEDARRAQRLGIQNNQAVIQATRALRDAVHSVADAQYEAAKAAKQQSAEEQNLNQILSKLDPSERRLFNTIESIRKRFKQLRPQLTDPIIEGFNSIAGAILKLLKDPRILSALTTLSNLLGGSLTKVANFLTSKQGRNFFLESIHEAIRLVPIITEGFLNFLKLIQGLSVAGNSPLVQFANFLSKAVGDLAKLTEAQAPPKSSRDAHLGGEPPAINRIIGGGVGELQQLASLLGSIFYVLESISGIPADSEKVSTTRALADNIFKFGDYIQAHRDDIRQFFTELFQQLGRLHIVDTTKQIFPLIADIIIVVGGVAKLAITLATTGAKVVKVLSDISGKIGHLLDLVARLIGAFTGLFGLGFSDKNEISKGLKSITTTVGEILIGFGLIYAWRNKWSILGKALKYIWSPLETIKTLSSGIAELWAKMLLLGGKLGGLFKRIPGLGGGKGTTPGEPTNVPSPSEQPKTPGPSTGPGTEPRTGFKPTIRIPEFSPGRGTIITTIVAATAAAIAYLRFTRPGGTTPENIRGVIESPAYLTPSGTRFIPPSITEEAAKNNIIFPKEFTGADGRVWIRHGSPQTGYVYDNKVIPFKYKPAQVPHDNNTVNRGTATTGVRPDDRADRTSVITESVRADKAQKTLDDFHHHFDGVQDALVNKVQTSKLPDAFKSIFDKLTNNSKTSFDSVISDVTGFLKHVVNLFTNSGLAKSVTGAFNSFTGAVSNLVSGATGGGGGGATGTTPTPGSVGSISSSGVAKLIVGNGTGQNEENKPGKSNQGLQGVVGKALNRANLLAGHFPYVWGGGHKDPPNPNTGKRGSDGKGPTIGPGYDCSGSVGAVLMGAGLMTGAPVSGWYGQNWPKAKGNEQIVVYSNAQHVFMKIAGRFFGTGGQGLGGGPAFQNHSLSGFAATKPPGFATGGEVMGRAGEPKHILAHAGEIILNKTQQAMLGGGRYLSNLFGFGGQRKSSFADGGVVGGLLGSGQVSQNGGVITINTNLLGLGALSALADKFSQLVKQQVASGNSAANKLGNALTNLFGTDGLFTKLDTLVTRLQQRASILTAEATASIVRGVAVARTSLPRSVGRNISAALGGNPIGRGFASRFGGIAENPQAVQDEIATALALRERLVYQEAARTAKTNLDRLKAQLKGATGARRDQILGGINQATAALETAQANIAQTTLDIFQRQQSLAQDAITHINQRAQNALSSIQGKLNRLQTLGASSPEKLAKSTEDLIAAERTALNTQRAALVKELARARARHDVATANQIQSQLQDIDSQLTQLVNDRIQAIVDSVESKFARSQSSIGSAQRINQALGNNADTGLDSQLFKITLDRIAGLQAALKAALSSGDFTQAAQIQQAIDSAKADAADAIAAFFSDSINNINKQFDNATSASNAARRIRAAFGQTPDQGLDQSIIDATRAKLAALQDLLAQAQAAGAPNLARDLQNQINALNGDLAEAVVQKYQDGVDAITTVSDANEQRLSVRQGIAQSLGNRDTVVAFLTQRIANGQNEIAQLTADLANAPSAELRQQLADKIDQLSASVTDLSVQLVNEQMSIINDNAQRSLAAGQRRQTLGGLGLTRDANGNLIGFPGGNPNFGEISAGLQQSGSALAAQRGGLSNLLAGQTNLPSDQQNHDLIRSLTDQINELDIQIVQNIDAINKNTDAQIQYGIDLLQSQQTNTTGIVGKINQFLQGFTNLTGQNTSQQQVSNLRTAVEALAKQITGDEGILKQSFGPLLGPLADAIQGLSGNSLVTFIQQNLLPNINDLVNQIQDPQQKQIFVNLINQLLDNANAIQDNTDAINQLNGVNNPQSFSSSAWQFFRSAIFNGNNGLLGQYNWNMSVPQSNGYSTGSPYYSGTTPAPTYQTFETNIYQAGQDIDPLALTKRLGFEFKTP